MASCAAAPYRNKYGHYASIVDTINDAEHRATTLRLVPLEARWQAVTVRELCI